MNCTSSTLLKNSSLTVWQTCWAVFHLLTRYQAHSPDLHSIRVCAVLSCVCVMCLCMPCFGRCAVLCGVLTSVLCIFVVCVCVYMCVIVNIWMCWSIHMLTRVVHNLIILSLPPSLSHHLIFPYSMRCEDPIVQAGYPHGGASGTQHSHYNLQLHPTGMLVREYVCMSV